MTPSHTLDSSNSDSEEANLATATVAKGIASTDLAQPSAQPELIIPSLSAQAALALGKQQAWNDLRTSLPLVLFDSLAILFTILSTVSMGLLINQPVTNFFMVGTPIMVLGLLRMHGLYPACGLVYSIEYRRIIRSSLLASLGIGFALALRHELAEFPILVWLTFSISLPVTLGMARPMARHIFSKYTWWTQPVVILGNGRRAEALFDRINGCRHEGLRAAGVVFDQHEHWRQESASQRQIFIGPANALESILRTTKACRLAVAERDVHQWRDYHSFRGIPHVMLPTDLEHHPTERMHLSEDAGEVSLHCHSALTNPWSLTLKRTMDLVLILATAPFWAPLMGAIAIALKVLDPGPLFYKQSRVGRFRKPFEALKFRSMVCDADSKLKKYLDDHPEMQAEWEATHKLKDDPRVTSIGKFLRKTSLDELPQLLNVLLGEMSLVGPRPIIDCSNYDREYIQENPEVFELYQMVRPGITGLWQVSGRNATSYQQRIAFDRFYLHNWTLNLDIFILWRTLKTALFREGAC